MLFVVGRPAGAQIVSGSAPDPIHGAVFDGKSPLYEAVIDLTNELTVEAWVDFDPKAVDWGRILDRLLPSAQSAFRLEAAAGGQVRWVTANGNTCKYTGIFRANHWAHIVGVLSRSQKIQKLYVDGLEVAHVENLDSSNLDHSAGPLRVGGDLAGNARFIGSIKRIALFARALSGDEISSCFRQAAGETILSSEAKPPTDAVADWTFPDNPGGVVAPQVGTVPLMRALEIGGADGPDTTNPASSLWFRQPAWEWASAFPVGNGHLGAMVFGGVQREHLALFAISPDGFSTAPEAAVAVKKARDLLFNGDVNAASDVLRKLEPEKPGSSLPQLSLGDLLIEGPGTAVVSDYCRSVDTDTAIARTTYRSGGTIFTREVFSSVPDQVMVVRLTSDAAQRINFTAQLLPPSGGKAESDSGVLFITGSHGMFGGSKKPVGFRLGMVAKNDGGSMTVEGGVITVHDADAVTLLLAEDVSSSGTDSAAQVAKLLTAASAKNFEQLRSAHLDDYRPWIRGITVDIGHGSGRATDERLPDLAQGADPALAALLFQYGRYMIITQTPRSELLSYPIPTVAMEEMLVQNRAAGGDIEILAQLPVGWSAGHIKGIRMLDGTKLDLEWKNAKLASAIVRSFKGTTSNVVYHGKSANLELQKGGNVTFYGK